MQGEGEAAAIAPLPNISSFKAVKAEQESAKQHSARMTRQAAKKAQVRLGNGLLSHDIWWQDLYTDFFHEANKLALYTL